MYMCKFERQTNLGKIALFVRMCKHHAQKKSLPLNGIECCDCKKLVTMEFSSSKEPVLRILAMYFNPENEANV